MRRVSSYLSIVIGFVGNSVTWLSKAGLIVMVLLIVTAVVARYFFRDPIAGVVELTELIMVLIVFGGIAYTQLVRGHVWVELLVSHLPWKTRVGLDAFTTLLAIGIFAIASWQTVLFAFDNISTGEVTQRLDIPLYPFRFVIAAGMIVMSLVLIMQFCHSLARLLKKEVGGR